MELGGTLLRERAREYERTEPLYTVEADRLDTLPDAFREGTYDWKDAEWVVRWYCRRSLGNFPRERREAIEGGFEENAFEDVRGAIEAALEADDVAGKLGALTSLEGVSVPVASAFLFYAEPERYLVVGRRTWSALYEAGALEEPYPDPASATEYARYLDACRRVADRFDLELVALYRALWRLGESEE